MEKVFYTALTVSMLVAVITNYLILYFFKWASGWRLIWQGFLVNLIWVISAILSVYLTFTFIVEKFRLGRVSGLIIMLAIGFLIPAIFTIGSLVLLRRYGKSPETPPRILPISLLIGILGLAIFVGGMFITMKIEDNYFPPPPITGE